jgi:hypothetical protein
MTEVDLIQLVAQNYTKKQLESHQQNNAHLKEELKKQIFKLNVKEITKVWYAFSKFIKNQCNSKMKTVDTQLIGIFLGDGKFYPSPDYLEAGNFKLHRDIYKDINSQELSMYR